MSAILEVHALNKSYGDHHVLTDFSVALQPNSITTILGPNGSGKTTFIKSILGILKSDSGTISINGEPCALPYSAALRRKFLYIPDDPLAVGYLTGRENLEYMSALYGVKLSRERAEAILEKYGLYERRDTLAKDYSRGMIQRLCLSYMEIFHPEILILDEPTNGLDIMAIHRIVDVLRSLAREGKTILIATHDMSFCKSVSDQIIMIREGRKLAEQKLEWFEREYGAIEEAVNQLLASA
ncbi:MAG: ABC transporter ATP-binding protein [Aristaeellaceae bacterium]